MHIAAEMYLQGASQEQIAERLGVSREQVTYDMREIRKQWQDRTALAIDERKAEELARLSLLERRFWEAYEDSRKDFTANTVAVISGAKGQNGTRKVKRTETRSGDPRFLDGVQQCIAMRCKLLGLNAPAKIVGAFIHDHDWGDEELRKIAKRYLGGAA